MFYPRSAMLAFAVVSLTLCCMFNETLQQSIWQFEQLSASPVMSEPNSINFCRNFLAVGGRNTESLWLFNYTEPYSPSPTQSWGQSSIQYTDLIPVHYDTYGMYAFYINATGTAINVAIVNSSLMLEDSYVISTSNLVVNLLLDDYYPLLFYTGTSMFGVLNVSDPTSAYILAQYNTSQSFDPTNPQSIAIPQGQNFAFFTQKTSGNVPLLRWDLADFRTMRVDVPYPYSFGEGQAIATDYKRRFLSFMDSTGRNMLSVTPPYNNVASFGWGNRVVETLFLDDYMISAEGSGPFPYRVLYISNYTIDGKQYYSFTDQDLIYSSFTSADFYSVKFRDGMLFGGDIDGEQLIQFSLTSDTGLNLASIGQIQLPYNYNCNKTNGLPTYPLAFVSSASLIVDASNVMPITNAQLKVTDGIRDAYWNYVRYSVTGYSTTGHVLQYYNNATKVWSSVSSFYQSDVDSGNIRLLPSAAYLSQCSGGSGPAAVTGTFTFTASDVWTRTLGSTTVSFAIVCCPTTTATLQPNTTVAQISGNLASATSYCTAAMPGYYTQSSNGAIKACPLGTFNPYVGGVDMRNSCYSCPVGATTTSVASTKWEDCSCQYCMLGKTEVMPVVFDASAAPSAIGYFFRPNRMILHPHAERPILVTAAIKTVSDAGVGLHITDDMTNRSYAGEPVFEFWMGGFADTVNLMRNVSDGLSDENTMGDIATAFTPDASLQAWFFYWQGFMAHGYIPLGSDATTDWSFRDRLLLYLLNNNTEGIDSGYFRVGDQAQFDRKNFPILGISYGGYNGIEVDFSNSWNVAIDDFIDNCDLVINNASLTLSASFEYLGSGLPADLAVTVLPPSAFNITGWYILGNVSATWIDLSFNSYEVNTDSLGYGTLYIIVVSNNSSDVSSWPAVTSFTAAQMSAGLVAVKMLQNQSSVAVSSFSVSFYPCHQWVRFCIATPFSLTMVLPPAPSNGALDIGSWAVVSGGAATSTPVTPPLNVYSAAANPGRRSGAAAAYVSSSYIYVYGGSLNAGSPFVSELWVFNISSAMWTKVGGYSHVTYGTYGAKGALSASYWPPSTSNSALAYDGQHNCLWLYGGQGYLNGSIWKFDLSLRQWGWMAGDLNPTSCATSYISSTSQPCPATFFGEMIVDSSFSAYALMGQLKVPGTLQNTVWKFNTTAKAFSLTNAGAAGADVTLSTIDPVTHYGTSRQNYFMSNAMIPGGSLVYQFGGSNTTTLVSGNAVWVFDTVLNSFKLVAQDEDVTLASLASLPFRTELGVSIYPRIRPLTAGDPFGNIWIYAGRTGPSAALLNDLYVFNTVAETYQWVSGGSSDSNIAVNRTASAGHVVVTGVPNYANDPPSSAIVGGLVVRSNARNSRLLEVYLVFSDAQLSENVGTQVWTLQAYVPPCVPQFVTKSSVSVNVLQTQKVSLNRSLFELVDYDTPAHSLKISVSRSDGYFQSAVNGSNLTYVTYEMVQSGLRAYFIPSNNRQAGSFNVSVTITDNSGNSVNGTFSYYQFCVSTNIDPTSCGCVEGMYDNGSNCVQCPANTFKSSALNNSCSACPQGSYTAGLTGSTNLSNCTVRPSFVVIDSSTQSYGCPKGTGLSATNDSCVTCGVDSYQSSAILAECSSCPSGTTTFSQAGKSYCWETAKYTLENSQVVCGQGYYSDGIQCVACSVDTYKAATGNSSCLLCPVGTTTGNQTASTLLQNCVQISASSTSATSASASSMLVIGIGVGVGCLVIVAVGAAAFIMRRKKQQDQLKKAVFINSGANGMNTNKSLLQNTNRSVAAWPLGPAKYTDVQTNKVVSLMSINNWINNTTDPSTLSQNLLYRTTQSIGHCRTATVAPSNGLYTAFPAFLLVDSDSTFRCRELIAEGGFAKLYKGDLIDKSVIPPHMLETEPDIAHKVAIKVFKTSEVSEEGNTLEEQFSSLENEATIMYALASLPNVARLLAISKKPQLAIAMQFYEESMDHFLYSENSNYRNATLTCCNGSWTTVCAHFAHNLIEGVSSMHMLNVVHLDLKPANFLLERLKVNSNFPFRLVITDFGLALFTEDMRASKASTAKTTAGISIRYASPEAFVVVRLLAKNCKTRKESFLAMDSYSTAVSIWEMFTREIPFKAIKSETLEEELLKGLKVDLSKMPEPVGPKEVAIINVFKSVINDATQMNAELRISVKKMLETVNQELAKVL